MRWHATVIAALCAGTIVGGSSAAAVGVDPATCRAIPDAAQRLACYDQATAPVASPAPPPLAPTVPPGPKASPQALAPPPGPPPPPARVSAPLPAAAPVPAPSATQLDQFGLDERQLIESGRAEKSPALALKSVTGRITQVGFRANGEFVVTLDNGQVWEQTEADPLALVRAGDRIEIRRAVLGSFLLVAANHENTRVRRVR
jgi:hypothetical protein